MFKKRDLVIIIILVALTLAAAAFLVSYRTSFSVGGVAATIDNTNNTIFVSLPEGSGTEQEITFNFPYEAGYIYISRIRQETGSKEVQTLESTTGPGDSGTTSSSRKDTGQSGLEGTQPGQDGTTASSSDFAGEKYTAGIDDEHAVRISSGQSFDFGSFISHCKIETASGEKYDLWVTTGNIPIITIEAGKNIPDEPKVDCTLDVLSPNPSNLTAGIEGEIELTGVSGDIPKSSYSFNIKEDPIMGDTPSILDFSPSKRFSLSASYTDPSIIREKLAADIFGLMSEDNTAPDSGYVELYLNGKYQGLYLLSRRVDRDMFSIPNYDPENDFPGVIYEAARREADFKMGPEGFSQVEPDYDSETPYMEPLEELISLVMDAPEEGFLKTAYDTLDIENTLDSHILFLLSGCSDPRAANQYIYRNNGSDSKFSFCPGNLYADSFGRRPDSTMVDPAWFFNGSRLFNRLYQEAGYREDLKARYSALREDILTVDNLVSLIDKSSSGLSCAWERNSTAWPISSSVYEDSMSPEEDIAYIKEYLKDRLTILDDYINHPPIIKIGDSYALINEEAHTIFCSLPPGADTVQEVSWECWPGAEVYMELLSLGEIGLYKDDFSEYSGIMANGRNTGEITIYIDNPRKDVEYPELNLLEEKVLLNGWALDPESKEGTGVERILVFDGPQTNKENFLGEASYGLSRPDVAQHFGNANYENSGYELCINTFHMENGKHELYIYVCDKNGGYSLEIYPIEVENKNNEADEIKESKTAKLENGGYYDFENFIYHGNWIINDKGTERTYDFWLTTGDVPIAVIDTNNQLINNQDKINAEVKIMYHDSGENNFINENNIDFTGRLGIKIRGKSSQGFPKKQYSIEIVDDEGNDMNVSLLGMPKEADWILGAPYTDKTFMRNMLAFELSNQMGYYAPRTRFVELFLNDREDLIMEGGYEGIYMLTERIKRDDDRVNIQTLDADDTDISGGYILEISSIDRVKENESSFTTERGTTFTNIYPDKKRITAEQKEWISGYINELEKLIYSDDFLDEKEGYAQYLDTGSLINYMIINELFKNRSLFWESTYLYKDRGGKLMVGPVWDFDLSAGKKGLTPEANNTLGWRYEDKLWIEQIFQDKKFVGEFIKKWNYFRQGPISDENIENIIDSNVEFLEDARIRNYKKWDILGKGVWPSCPPIPETYEEEIDTIKSWFFERTEWIDENIDSLLNNK